MKDFNITLQEKMIPWGRNKTIAGYAVLLNGKEYCKLYPNISGYNGSVPQPNGIDICKHDYSLDDWQKLIDKINNGETAIPTKILHKEVTGCYNCPAYRWVEDSENPSYHSCNLDATFPNDNGGMYDAEDGFAPDCPLIDKA